MMQTNTSTQITAIALAATAIAASQLAEGPYDVSDLILTIVAASVLCAVEIAPLRKLERVAYSCVWGLLGFHIAMMLYQIAGLNFQGVTLAPRPYVGLGSFFVVTVTVWMKFRSKTQECGETEVSAVSTEAELNTETDASPEESKVAVVQDALSNQDTKPS